MCSPGQDDRRPRTQRGQQQVSDRDERPGHRQDIATVMLVGTVWNMVSLYLLCCLVFVSHVV